MCLIWLKAHGIHKGRVIGAICYFCLGVLSLFHPHPEVRWVLTVFKGIPVAYWCIGWPAIGIGAGLINTRKKKAPSPFLIHYILYYGFVWVLVVLFAYVTACSVGREHTGETFRFRAIAMLVGLVGGFLGDKLHEIVMGFLPKQT